MRILTSSALLLLLTTGCGSSDMPDQSSGQVLDSASLVQEFNVEAEHAGRVARETNRYIESIGGQESYRDVLVGIGAEPNPFSIAQAGAFLTLRGAVRLGESATDSVANLRSDWIRQFGCEQTIAPSPGSGWRLMASLDSAELSDLVDFYIETTRAVTNEVGDIPQFDQERLVYAWRAFHSRLPITEQDRFVRFLDNPQPSMEERCWFQRRLWEQLPQLPAEDARIILSQLATNRY